MRDRRPRKAKKQAKKKKAKADAAVMAQCALACALSAVQIAATQSIPIPKFNSTGIPYAETIRKQKAIAITQMCIDAARIQQQIMLNIKPWRYYADGNSSKTAPSQSVGRAR